MILHCVLAGALLPFARPPSLLFVVLRRRPHRFTYGQLWLSTSQSAEYLQVVKLVPFKVILKCSDLHV